MKSLALLAAGAVCCYFFYRHQHPASGDVVSNPVRPTTSATAGSTPALHYHSPLDAGNARNASGYYSTAPTDHYEVSGPRSTASGRAMLAPAKKPPASPDDP